MFKNTLKITINKRSIIVDEKNDNIIRFSKPVVITDNSEQWNGTSYDIKTLNIDTFKGTVTTNHIDKVENVVANVIGLEKVGNKVTIEGLDFAKNESSYANMVYNLMVGGYINDFSTETSGDYPDENGVFKNHDLVGLSIVVSGNNKSASINQCIKNSLEESRKLGLDTSEVEQLIEKDEVVENTKEIVTMFKTIKNNRSFTLLVKYKNAAGEEVEAELKPGASVDVSEDQEQAVKDQVAAAEDTQAKVEAENKMGEILKEMQDLKKEVANSRAQAPKYDNSSHSNSADVKAMNHRDRFDLQVNSAVSSLLDEDVDAKKTLRAINEHNFAEYKAEGIVRNTMTISSLGNFVIPKEMITEIQRCDTDYRPLLDIFGFRETLSLEAGFVSGSGDIDMQNVEMCDDGENGNRKPISEYSLVPGSFKLEELAAVTPVCNAATRFLAVDILGDIASRYRRDYDRKKAQLVIARLQQAVDTTGNEVTYSVSASDPAVALESWINTWSEVISCAPNGIFVFSQSTYAELLRRGVRAGVVGGDLNLFTTGNQPMILGKRYIIVSDDLLPTLGTSQTRTFQVIDVAGVVQTVTVDNAVFYVDPSTFTGRVSGGLQYDMSAHAAYEVSGTVRSAFQRNEIVLRGSMYRGGQILLPSKVSGLKTVAVS